MGYEVIRDAVVVGLTGHGFIVPVSADNWNFIDVLVQQIYEHASIEEHDLVGTRHTVSGLVPDRVLRAITADTFGFRSLDDLYYPRAELDALLAAQNELSEMEDVVITGITDEELLVYDTDASKWINQTRTEAELAGINDTATIGGLWTFSRGSANPPFAVLPSDASYVQYLDADKLDGYHESHFAALGDTETVTGLWTFSRGSANPPFAVLPSDAAYVQYLDADKVDGLHAEQFARSDVGDTITGPWTMSGAGEIRFRAAAQTIWSSALDTLDMTAGATFNQTAGTTFTWTIGVTQEMSLTSTELKLDDARIHMNNHDIYDVGEMIWKQYIAPSTYTTTLKTLAVLSHPGFQMEAVKSGYTATGVFGIHARTIDGVAQDIWVFGPGLYVYDSGGGTGNIYATGQLVTLYGGAGAPIKVVNSTNLCTNLNADLLDSQHGAYYLDPTNMSGAVRGSILRGNADPAWEVYALGTTGYILRSDGSDIIWTNTFTADMTFSGNVKAIFNDANKYVHWDNTDIAFVTDSGDFKFSGGDVVVSGQMIVQHDGTEPTWGHSPTGLAVEGTSEFDGDAWFDSRVYISHATRAEIWFAPAFNSAGFNADGVSDQFVLGLRSFVGRQFVLSGWDWIQRDFDHADTGHPRQYWQDDHDPNVSNNAFGYAGHDGTGFVIGSGPEWGEGSVPAQLDNYISFAPRGTEKMRVHGTGLVAIHDGTEPAWTHSPTGLAVEGTSEFDGDAWFDGEIRLGKAAATHYNRIIFSEGGVNKAAINSDFLYDQMLLGVSTEVGRQFILCDYASFGRDFDHAPGTNVRFFVQGPSNPNDNNTRWWSIEFDETTDNERAIYNVGSGRHEFQYQGNRILTMTRYSSVETRLEFDQDDIFAIDTTLDMRLHPIQNVNWMAIATIYDITHNDPVRIPKGIELDEITEPAAPEADRLRLFAKDDGGKTALYVRFPSGASQLVLVEV